VRRSGEVEQQYFSSPNRNRLERTVAKGYWIVFYKSISDSAAVAEYAKLAGAAIQSAGGAFIVRGTPAKIYEAGLNMRTVVIEFETVEKAVAAYQRSDYQAALRLLDGKVERDVRIVEGAA
jgi:uncharacterized protein (DUF1330 family)